MYNNYYVGDHQMWFQDFINYYKYNPYIEIWIL
jgi:hypothetical protein